MAGVLRLERGEINCPLKNVLIVDDHIDRHKWVLKDNSELGLRVTVGHTVFSGAPIGSHLKYRRKDIVVKGAGMLGLETATE